MRNDDFEWDDATAASNLDKHHVDFWTARRVFDDPFLFDDLDTSDGYGEDRYVAIGLIGDILLVVVYTDRGDRSRIISARKAEPYERRTYDHR